MSMRHDRCWLVSAEVRRRSATFRGSTDSFHGRIPGSVLSRCAEGAVYLDLVGLLPGECVALHHGFFFRVLRGTVDLNGHVYSPSRADYTKVLIPRWSPPERMVALCSYPPCEAKPAVLEEHPDSSSCGSCNAIMGDALLGGSCCGIRDRLSSDGALLRRHLNLRSPPCSPSPAPSDPDQAAVDFYDSLDLLKGGGSTVVAFVAYTGAFGTTDLRRIFAQHRLPKVISPALPLAASALLESCTKGEGSPVLMVHGDKGSGKSTSVFYLVNYLLNHLPTVAVLDTDVGQPLFSAPGMISLKFVTSPVTTPPHSLAAEHRPDVCYLVGDVKVSSPELIMRHVHRCFEVYVKCVEGDRGVPLIVNTFGWVSGMGAKLLECIASITKVSVMLRLNTRSPNGGGVGSTGPDSGAGTPELPSILSHGDLERALKAGLSIEPDMPATASAAELAAVPVYKNIVESCGARLPWDRRGCEIIETPGHCQAYRLISELLSSFRSSCSERDRCSLRAWDIFRGRRASCAPAPSDLRWLRVCSTLNPSFGDALHFPHLHSDEFFGGFGGPSYWHFVRDGGLFLAPRSLVLKADRLSFVARLASPVSALSDLCPALAGSVVALCTGRCESFMCTEISSDWEFVSYVYVHYLNAEDMTMLVSHSVNASPAEISRASIAVWCPGVGFDAVPTRLCGLTSYPSVESSIDRLGGLWRARELSTSQFVPFRRNNLLHMLNAQGAGNASGSARKNLKRPSQSLKRE